MSSTNHTTNYNLSQYVGTDKPTYLGDYNGDMGKIDTAIHNNATSISGVSGDVSTLSSKVGTLSELETTTKSDCVSAINEVNTKSETNKTNIGTLSNLETTDKSTVVNAVNEVKGIIDNFNLTEFHDITNADITMTDGTINGSSSIQYATNSDGSLAKIYGWLGVTCTGIRSPKIEFNTTLRPSSKITINGMYIAFPSGSGATNNTPSPASVEIATTGKVTLRIWNSFSINNAQYTCNLIPVLIYVKDFGDVPISQ